MAGLCRFCAKSEQGVDVFSEEGQERNIYSKIKLCLPINITINDGMTTHICFSCIKKLNISYEFHTTSISVQYQLRNHLESQEKAIECSRKNFSNPHISSQKSPDRTCNVTNNNSNSTIQSNVTFLKTNTSGIIIEAVQSISENTFQNFESEPDSSRKNGKRLLENSAKETPDTAKKKERMTVCQYCRRWFPRSIILQHEKLHVKGSITFNCTSCNKDFQEAKDFTNHTCVNEGD